LVATFQFPNGEKLSILKDYRREPQDYEFLIRNMPEEEDFKVFLYVLHRYCDPLG